MTKDLLLVKTIFSVFTGIIFGQIVCYVPYDINFFIKILLSLTSIFSEYLSFLIPIIILSLVTSSILNLGTNATILLIRTIVLSILSMLLASFLAYFCVLIVCSYVLYNSSMNFITSLTNIETYSLLQLMPIMNITTAMVLAISLGLAGLGKKHITNLFNDLKNIILFILDNVIIPCIPYYIGLSFFKISYTGYLLANLSCLLSLVLCVIFIQIVFIILIYILVGLYVRQSPIKLLLNMLPAYVTAASTMSSTMSIPMTLNISSKNNISNQINEFVIPICATIHLPGTAINQIFSSLAIYYIFNGGIFPELGTILLLIISIVIVLIAAPAVPGGAIMSTISILKSILLLPEPALSLMYIVSITNDCFSTGTNVMCDGAMAVLIDNNLKKNK